MSSIDLVISEAKNDFAKAIEHLKEEFTKFQTGRASTVLVENIMVEAYGAAQPIKGVAQINIPEARSIQIKPWDKSMLKNIETSIRNSDLGLNPINNGENILINLPMLTEERRKDLVKLVGKAAEEARIAIRQVRQKSMQKFKDMEKKEEISEDQVIVSEKKLQTVVDDYNKQIDELADKKEHEVMTV